MNRIRITKSRHKSRTEHAQAQVRFFTHVKEVFAKAADLQKDIAPHCMCRTNKTMRHVNRAIARRDLKHPA